MRLFSVQNRKVWDKLRAEGIVFSDGRRVWHDFRPAYRYMSEQMRVKKVRCAPVTGQSPFWAWCTEKQPSLRIIRTQQNTSLRQEVLIELEIPEERILLSDFQAWHFVLNNQYLSLTEEDDEDECRDVKDVDQRVISWGHVFDLDSLARSPLWGDCRLSTDRVQSEHMPHNEPGVQACFGHIDYRDVVSVKLIKKTGPLLHLYRKTRRR